MVSPLAARPDALARCAWLAIAGQVLLLLGGLRHHLVWGGRGDALLVHALNGFESAALAGAVWLGGFAWWRARGLAAEATSRRRWTLALLAVAVLVPPFLTADPIDYVVRGRVLAVHGANPYLQVASDFPDDPFLAFGDRAWKSFPLPYGPIVANVQAAVAWLAHAFGLPPLGELIVALLLFKLLFATALWWVAVMGARLVERLRPGRGPAAFVAIAWNPLLLIECVANAHNEPLVMLALLGAAMALCVGRTAWAAFALGCGAMTKVVPALLLPLWAVVAWRTACTRGFALGLGGVALLAALFAWQFGDPVAALSVLQRQNELRGASVWWLVHELTGAPLAALVTVGRIGVVTWLAIACLRAWRTPTPRTWLHDAGVTLAALAVFGAPLFGPWYHAWWVPFALLLERGPLFRLACAASVVAPLGWFVWTATRRHDVASQVCIVVLAVLVPPLVAWRWPNDDERPDVV